MQVLYHATCACTTEPIGAVLVDGCLRCYSVPMSPVFQRIPSHRMVLSVIVTVLVMLPACRTVPIAQEPSEEQLALARAAVEELNYLTLQGLASYTLPQQWLNVLSTELLPTGSNAIVASTAFVPGLQSYLTNYAAIAYAGSRQAITDLAMAAQDLVEGFANEDPFAILKGPSDAATSAFLLLHRQDMVSIIARSLENFRDPQGQSISGAWATVADHYGIYVTARNDLAALTSSEPLEVVQVDPLNTLQNLVVTIAIQTMKEEESAIRATAGTYDSAGLRLLASLGR